MKEEILEKKIKKFCANSTLRTQMALKATLLLPEWVKKILIRHSFIELLLQQ